MRSAYRPSQNKSSAMRLGKSPPPRLNATGWVEDGSRVTGLTGPSARIHVSLLRPPFCNETTSDSLDFVIRESAPCITV